MNAPARRGRPPRQPVDAEIEGAMQAEVTGLNVSPRLAEQRAARLARGDNDKSAALRLGVDESKLDTENFTYRFANDDEGRLQHLTQNKDYEYVSNSDLGEPTDDMGDAVSRVIGTKKDGSAQRAVLVRKPKGWYEEDKSKDRKPQDDAMAASKRAQVPNKGGATLTERDNAYVPESGIRITTPSTGGFEP